MQQWHMLCTHTCQHAASRNLNTSKTPPAVYCPTRTISSSHGARTLSDPGSDSGPPQQRVDPAGPSALRIVPWHSATQAPECSVGSARDLILSYSASVLARAMGSAADRRCRARAPARSLHLEVVRPRRTALRRHPKLARRSPLATCVDLLPGQLGPQEPG